MKFKGHKKLNERAENQFEQQFGVKDSWKNRNFKHQYAEGALERFYEAEMTSADAEHIIKAVYAGVIPNIEDLRVEDIATIEKADLKCGHQRKAMFGRHVWVANGMPKSGALGILEVQETYDDQKNLTVNLAYNLPYDGSGNMCGLEAMIKQRIVRPEDVPHTQISVTRPRKYALEELTLNNGQHVLMWADLAPTMRQTVSAEKDMYHVPLDEDGIYVAGIVGWPAKATCVAPNAAGHVGAQGYTAPQSPSNPVVSKTKRTITTTTTKKGPAKQQTP